MTKRQDPEFLVIKTDYEKAVALALETMRRIPEGEIVCVAVVAITGGERGGHVAQFWNASTYDKLALAGVIQMEAITESTEEDDDGSEA